jgi:hypothetical protein
VVAVTRPQYGETWVYESMVGALPGVDLDSATAIGIQILAFEAGLILVAWRYDLWGAVVPGTAAVAVAAIGSALMLTYAARIRELDAPAAYRRLLFGSNAEVVLGVLGFVATVTHLFVYDPRTTTDPLLTALLGDDPPILATYLLLLVLWDVVYRVATSWWAAITGVWRAYAYSFDHKTASAYVRADALNFAFTGIQLLFLPFVLDRPILLVALVGHELAVAAATAVSVTLTYANRTTTPS